MADSRRRGCSPARSPTSTTSSKPGLRSLHRRLPGQRLRSAGAARRKPVSATGNDRSIANQVLLINSSVVAFAVQKKLLAEGNTEAARGSAAAESSKGRDFIQITSRAAPAAAAATLANTYAQVYLDCAKRASARTSGSPSKAPASSCARPKTNAALRRNPDAAGPEPRRPHQPAANPSFRSATPATARSTQPSPAPSRSRRSPLATRSSASSSASSSPP